MILTVTPNGSVDLVLRRIGPVSTEEQPVVPVAETAGGKGHNVARFLASTGHAVTAAGFAGGWVGKHLAALLRDSGVEPRLTTIAGLTRRYTTILADDADRVSFHMAGPTVSEEDCARLVADVVALALDAHWIVLAGSIPPGAPPDLFARIIAATGGDRVIVDTSGDALLAAVRSRPAVVKVNATELARLGEPMPHGLDAPAWEHALSRIVAETGVAEWWVTLGPDGAVGWTTSGLVMSAAATIRPVNTTGAGDAFLVGILLARLAGERPEAAVIRAVAWAATVAEQEAPEPPDAARISDLTRALSTT